MISSLFDLRFQHASREFSSPCRTTILRFRAPYPTDGVAQKGKAFARALLASASREILCLGRTPMAAVVSALDSDSDDEPVEVHGLDDDDVTEADVLALQEAAAKARSNLKK